MKQYYVYIITNQRNGTLYIGMCNDLERRMREHKAKEVNGFSKRYNLTRLVYFETHSTSSEAFVRERQMKKWNRKWKIELIESKNPQWQDLASLWS